MKYFVSLFSLFIAVAPFGMGQIAHDPGLRSYDKASGPKPVTGSRAAPGSSSVTGLTARHAASGVPVQLSKLERETSKIVAGKPAPKRVATGENAKPQEARNPRIDFSSSTQRPNSRQKSKRASGTTRSAAGRRAK